MKVGDKIILEAVERKENDCEGCYFQDFYPCIWDFYNYDECVCEGLILKQIKEEDYISLIVGLEQAKRGKTISRGSFAKHLEDIELETEEKGTVSFEEIKKELKI